MKMERCGTHGPQVPRSKFRQETPRWLLLLALVMPAFAALHFCETVKVPLWPSFQTFQP